jgi:hypothetical protein
MTPLLKNLLLALGLAVIGWLGYYLFLGEQDDVIVTDQATTEAIQRGQELLVLFQQVESITFNGGVLEDVRFTSLIDLHQTIESEPVGRSNPFAPLP